MEETLPVKQNAPSCQREAQLRGIPSQLHSSHFVSLPALPPIQALGPVLPEVCSIGELEVPVEADGSIYGAVYAFISQITTTPAILGEILAQFERIESQPHPPTPLKTAKLLPTRRGFKNGRTSLNQLGESEQVGRDVECARGRPCVRFRQERQNISIKLINSRKNDLSRSALSFKETHNPSKSIKEETILLEMDSAEELDPHSSSSSPRNSYKKVSIVMFEEVDRGSDIFSSEGRITLKDLQLPQLKLSEQLIEELLDSPSPFLATLTLALLLKFLMRSKFAPLVTQIGWLLGVASLVAYKVFFDETIEGLVEYYSRALGMRGEEIRLLERWFLSGLNYEAVISREHYLEVMLRLAPHRGTAQ